MNAASRAEPWKWTRRESIYAAVVAAYAAAIGLTRGTLEWALAGVLVLAPLIVWVLRSANAWLILFFLVALLAPPLPASLGNSGPHPALFFAGLGLVVGLVRLAEWRFSRGVLPGTLIAFLAALAISVAPAALYSGEEIAFASLARVGLFAISIFIFFYVSAGPGRAGGISPHLLYGIAVLSAAFACVDFYYQFPPPAGYGAQFVWLDSGVYRRAQGLFYEAGTLGNFCAFFLIMTVVALARRIGNRAALVGGGAVFAAALILSYSRSSVLNAGFGLTALLAIERRRVPWRRLAAPVAGLIAASAIVVYEVFPAFAASYWARISTSVTHGFSLDTAVLGGRFEAWGTLARFLIANPWHAVLGVGYKTLPYSDFIGRPVVTDNMYLSLLVETGVIGLGALLALNFAILRAGYQAAHSPDPERSFYGTWIFCFWVGQIVQMLSVDLLTFWRVLPLYLWVLAMAVRR